MVNVCLKKKPEKNVEKKFFLEELVQAIVLFEEYSWRSGQILIEDYQEK